MGDYVVWNVPGSPFGRAALVTLEEKGVRWRLEAVAPGSLKSAEHARRHPFGRIPTLSHDDFELYETQAILRYIDRTAPGPVLTPADPRAAARMDQLLNLCDWYLCLGGGQELIFQRVVAPKVMGIDADEAVVADTLPRVRATLAELARLLGDQAFFTGNAISLADLHIAPHLDLLMLTPEWPDLIVPHPALADWAMRVLARPSFRATTMERLFELAA